MRVNSKLKSLFQKIDKISILILIVTLLMVPILRIDNVIFNNLLHDPLNRIETWGEGFYKTNSNHENLSLYLRLTTSDRNLNDFREDKSPFLRDGNFYIWLIILNHRNGEFISDNITFDSNLVTRYGYSDNLTLVATTDLDLLPLGDLDVIHNLSFNYQPELRAFKAVVPISNYNTFRGYVLYLGFNSSYGNWGKGPLIGTGWETYLIPKWLLPIVSLIIILVVEQLIYFLVKHKKQSERKLHDLVKEISEKDPKMDEDMKQILKKHNDIMKGL